MQLKITKVSYSMTRQVTSFHPAVYSMEAEVSEGQTAEQVALELQKMVIKVLYRDQQKQRDMLIESLCHPPKVDNSPQAKSPDAPSENKASGPDKLGTIPNF
jgi:hypothetical protein